MVEVMLYYSHREGGKPTEKGGRAMKEWMTGTPDPRVAALAAAWARVAARRKEEKAPPPPPEKGEDPAGE